MQYCLAKSTENMDWAKANVDFLDSWIELKNNNDTERHSGFKDR